MEYKGLSFWTAAFSDSAPQRERADGRVLQSRRRQVQGSRETHAIRISAISKLSCDSVDNFR